MQCSPRFFRRSFFTLLFGFVLVFLTSSVSAQINFNINYITNVVPYSGKQYADIWSEGDIACLGIFSGYGATATPPFGVGIYNIANPTSPVFLANYTYPANHNHNQFEQGVVRDKIGYFASWSSGGMHIVSLTNPASPVLLSRIMPTSTDTNVAANGFARVHTMFLERNFLYQAAHVDNATNVKVFNVSNPHMPTYVRDVVTTNTARVHQITAAKKGDKTILYTSGWGTFANGSTGSTLGQTDIWDVTDIGGEPAKWLGRIYSGVRSHSSWPTPDGNSLVVCREIAGGEVTIWDISDPSNPTVQSVINPHSMGIGGNEMPHNPVIVSNLLFLSWFRHGIQIFDIEDRTKPVWVGSYDTFLTPNVVTWEGNWGVDPTQGLSKLLLSDMQRGLFILDASAVLTGTNIYAPLLVKNPNGQTVGQGHSVTFTPVITGSLLNYQWRLGGTNISGATNSIYTISFAEPDHSGNYTVVATNISGSVTSLVAALSVSVHASAPAITGQPQPISVYPEQSAMFSVAVSGEAPFFYQWRFKGTDIPGGTNATYTIPSVHNSQAGNYSVLVTNSYGGIVSSNALLTIIDSPYISGVTAHPGLQNAIIAWNTTVPADSKVDFGPFAEGSVTGSSPRNPELATQHSALLTGLQPATTYNYQVISRAGGTNFLSGIYQFTTASAGPIIVDNADNAKVSFVGAWTSSTNVSTYYGSNYHWANTISVGLEPDRTATFTPTLLASGNYDVDAWYAASSNDRATNAPFTISHNAGNTVVRMNQKINGGQWNLLAAQLPFSAGSSGFVRLGNNASGGNVVIADAVRFSYSANQLPPNDSSFPIWWSEFYFGGLVDPNVDHDSDGFTTGQEYILGTSPTSAAQKLSVKVFRSGGTANVIFHPLHAARTYTLQQKSNLSDSWQPASFNSFEATPEGDGVFSLSLNNGAQSFYRIAVQLNPNPTTLAATRAPVQERRMFAGIIDEPGCGPGRIYAE